MRIGILLLVVATILCSCKTRTISVPVETVKTVYKEVSKRDSIVRYDSVFVDRWKSNDTVFITKEKFQYLYRDKLSRDSIYINDTIRVPFPVIETKTLKSPYNWYEKLLMALRLVAIGFLGFRVYLFLKKLG